MKWVFFGSSDFSVYILDELKLHNILPSLIITTPDKPKGRKLILTPTPTKIWAQKNNMECIAPTSLKNNFDLVYKLKSKKYNLFLIASYGKIIPSYIFDIPEHKTLNIHPSLLPKYRGASPIQAQILNGEKDVGVTIMQIVEEMDAGPIVTKQKFQIPNSKFQIPSRKELEKLLAIEGARLFAHILPEWLSGTIQPIIQNEREATYCKKITREDGLLDLVASPRINLLKIKAFDDWPGTYFFHNSKRVLITDAIIEDDELKILKVIPEGKKEMPYQDFLRGQK